MAPLVPDASLLRFNLIKNKIIYSNETFFMRDKHCPLTVCLHLMEPILTKITAQARFIICKTLEFFFNKIGPGVLFLYDGSYDWMTSAWWVPCFVILQLIVSQIDIHLFPLIWQSQNHSSLTCYTSMLWHSLPSSL